MKKSAKLLLLLNQGTGGLNRDAGGPSTAIRQLNNDLIRDQAGNTIQVRS